MPTKRAEDLCAGDRFSYVGSFKTYVAKNTPRLDRGMVLLLADAGPMQDVICIQLRPDAECEIHEESKKPDSPLLPGLRAARDAIPCRHCQHGDVPVHGWHARTAHWGGKPCPRDPVLRRIAEEERK